MPEEHQDFNLKDFVAANREELTRTFEVRPDAEVTIKYLPLSKWRKLRRRLRQMKGSEAARDQAADANTRALLADCCVGIRGFTPEIVGQFLPVKLDGLPDELPFSKVNIMALLEESAEFQSIYIQEVEDLAEFRRAQKEESEKN